jgi:hypothetical protein
VQFARVSARDFTTRCDVIAEFEREWQDDCDLKVTRNRTDELPDRAAS